MTALNPETSALLTELIAALAELFPSSCDCGCGRTAGESGYAPPCFRRWDRAGRPESGPPPPLPAGPERRAPAVAALREAFEARVDDYAWLRASGESVTSAARRVGIAEKTARCRYEPKIASGERADAA